MAVLCRGLEKNSMVRAWHGRGMASVNQTRPHCVNQMGKTHSKPLAARHGRGTAWARHGNGMLCVNPPLQYKKHTKMQCFKQFQSLTVMYIWNVDRAVLNTVFENTVRRVNKCLETGGGHFEHYL